MPLKESEAIVLRAFPLGEGDRLVSFLDRQSGVLRGVARGAGFPKSRFGSTLELLSHIRIWYFERETRDLVRINQSELIESFLDVQRDYRAGTMLALISEVTEGILGQGEVADAQFRLLLLTARAIKQHGPSPVILAYFSLWTVRLGGWLGLLEQCSRCGRPFGGEPAYFSAGSLGFSCAGCRQEWMRPFSPSARMLGRKIIKGTLDSLLQEEHSQTGANEISSVALDILEHHMERMLMTRKLLETGANE